MDKQNVPELNLSSGSYLNITCGDTTLRALKCQNGELRILTDTHTNSDESVNCLIALLEASGPVSLFLDMYEFACQIIAAWIEKYTVYSTGWNDGRFVRYDIRELNRNG